MSKYVFFEIDYPENIMVFETETNLKISHKEIEEDITKRSQKMILKEAIIKQIYGFANKKILKLSDKISKLIRKLI